MQNTLGARFEYLKSTTRTTYFSWLFLIATGLLMPLGFAPFHLPGASLIALSLFYTFVQRSLPRQAFFYGLLFGVGFFGLGVSWISISIHNYGHLGLGIAYLITAVFVLYLALFPACCALLFSLMSYSTLSSLKKVFLFSGLWCLSEYARSTLFTGFPWLLLGFGQIDTPLHYLLPVTGIYGLSFLAVLAACCLAYAIRRTQSVGWLLGFVLILIGPQCLKSIQWSTPENKAFTVGIVQANIAMRDKWDDAVFWKILQHYQTAIHALIPKTQMIFLPESAFPLPAVYIQDFLNDLHTMAKIHRSAIVFGMPTSAELPHDRAHPNSDMFYNTLSTLGHATGLYHKQHLVPFGEYVPAPFAFALRNMNLITSDLLPGQQSSLVYAHHHPFASLICYELAYPNLLRQQLPAGEWIVSLSDDGWFGHSLAAYQHLQMAQTLSMLTSRYQIVANNDGLSSIITPQGHFSATLPAFTAGILEGRIYPMHGNTPWIKWGDFPIFGCCIGVIMMVLNNKLRAKFKQIS